MPELPEVETVVRSLAPHLPGRTIVSVELRSPFVTPGDRAGMEAQLAGRRIAAIRRHGKFIVVELDRGVLVIHLGMTGKLLLDVPVTTHSYGIFHLDRGMLLYDDPRQFGRIEYALELPDRVARLGPDPLTVPLEDFLSGLRARRSRSNHCCSTRGFCGGSETSTPTRCCSVRVYTRAPWPRG